MTKQRPLDDIFEECLELVFSGEPIEACLERFPEHAGELRGLLETAVATRKAVAVEPRPEFRERAREQMAEILRARPSPSPRRSFWRDWQPRWAVAAAAALAVVVAVCGVTLAANTSMPGQPLYAVEQATEQLRLALTPSPLSRANLYAAFADRRVSEIVYLSKRGDYSLLQQTTQRLQSDLGQVALLASTAPAKAAAFGSGDNSRRASTVVPELTSPPSASAPVLAAPAAAPSQTVSAAGNQTENATPNPPVTIAQLPPPTITVSVPPEGSEASSLANLKARVTYLSQVDQARLQEALASASPEARQALLNAMAVSEGGYEQVLQTIGTQP